MRLAHLSVLITLAPLAAQTQEPSPGLTWVDPLASNDAFLFDDTTAVAAQWDIGSAPGVSSYLDHEGNILRNYIEVSEPQTFGTGVERRRFNGDLVWRYVPTVGDGPHHDIEPLPNGNVLMIVADDYTQSEMAALGRDPANTDATWRSEMIIEVQPTGPTTGTIVWQWRAIDHLVQDFDPNAPNCDVIADRAERIDVNYPAQPASTLWFHMNAIDYNAELDQIAVSCRNWNEIWILDHSTTTAEAAGSTGGDQNMGGDILYRWGNPAAYDTAGTQTLAQQHDINWIEPGHPGAGNLICFNNRYGQLIGQGSFSAITEFTPPVTPTGGYARAPGQPFGPAAPHWQYTAPNPADLASAIVSSAQRLPNGNTLVHSGQQGRTFEIGAGDQVIWEVSTSMAFKARRYDLSLWQSGDALSAASGGVVEFDLVAGSAHAGELYFLGGSITGTDPGIPLGAIQLPLEFDAYTLASAGSTLLPGSIGTLDGMGRSVARFELPPLVGQGFVGTTFFHAFLTLDASLAPSFASNPRGILLAP